MADQAATPLWPPDPENSPPFPVLSEFQRRDSVGQPQAWESRKPVSAGSWTRPSDTED